MWNRRDYITLATSAVAAFSLTAVALSTRVLNAVDEKPVPTTDVKVPALELSGVQVTAAISRAADRTVIFTVRNTTQQPAKAEFAAQASNAAPSNRMSRVMLLPRPVWTENFATDLQPGETKTITATLPAEAFAYVAEAAAAPVIANSNTAAQIANGKIPGRTFLVLAPKASLASEDRKVMLFGLPGQVEVLTLSSQAPAQLAQGSPPDPAAFLQAAAPAAARNNP
jgi:hypothetical protein